jgi:hypothetical protein
MTAVVDEILNVKLFREDLAQTEVRRRRYALDEAARRVEERKREVLEYRAWRVTRESELYDTIENQLVHVRDLEDLKASIAFLRDQERVIEQKVLEAEKGRGEARAALDKAIEAQAQAVRQREKFEELMEVWRELEQFEADRKEEAEVEDLYAQLGGPADGPYAHEVEP